MMDIADLEDECLIKLRDLEYANMHRKNTLQSEVLAWHQSNKIERIHGALARSNVGPALLCIIEKKTQETGKILREMRDLDDKILNPQKYEEERKQKYIDFKQQRMSVLST